MTAKLLAGLFLGLCVILAAGQAATQQNSGWNKVTGDLRAGDQIFTDNCGLCHRPAGENFVGYRGYLNMWPDTGQLSDKGLDRQIRERARNPLSAAERKKLLAFIRSLEEPDSKAPRKPNLQGNRKNKS